MNEPANRDQNSKLLRKEIEPSISSEVAAIAGEGEIKEVGRPPEIPKEVERAGVRRVGEIVIPPKISQMGVKVTGPSAPLPQPAPVSLPISDDKIFAGAATGNATLSLWALAIWCIRQLKKAHIVLRKIGDKIIRIRR